MPREDEKNARQSSGSTEVSDLCLAFIVVVYC